MLHGAEFVPDEESCEAEASAERGDEVENFFLRDDVQGARRLVEEHDVGFLQQRSRDDDALQLAARHLVRQSFEDAGRKMHLGEHGEDAAFERVFRLACLFERRAEEVAHLHARRKGFARILEDHAHDAFFLHRAFVGRFQPRDDAKERRLARAACPDDAADLAGREPQRHAAQDFVPAALGIEGFLYVRDLKERGHIFVHVGHFACPLFCRHDFTSKIAANSSFV